MRFRLAATLAVLALTTAAHAQSGYTYTKIDPFGSTNVSLTGINDSGQIVGSYLNSASSGYYGYLGSVHSNSYTSLDPFGSTSVFINGINSTGQLVGTYLPPGAYTLLSFSGTLSSSTYTTLLSFGENYTEALGLNDAGQIVGDSRDPSNPQYPLGFTGTLGSSTYTALDPFSSPYTLANGINNAGQIVGFYTAPDSTGGINLGHGYGYAGTLGSSTYTTIDPFNSANAVAYGINNVGQIVGSYLVGTPPFSGPEYGYVGILGSSSYTTIDPFGSQDVVVRGINDAGDIVGVYTDPSTGNLLGFEGTPLSPVPEASSTISFGLLLALGMGGLVINRPHIAAKRKKVAASC